MSGEPRPPTRYAKPHLPHPSHISRSRCGAPGGKADVSNISEIPSYADRVVDQLDQPFRNRLDSPPTKIPERYTRLGGTVALEVTCNLGGVKFRMFPLISFQNPLHLTGKNSRARTHTENQFSVPIDDIEVVDDPQGVVKRIGGVIRLQLFDESPNIRVCDSLYFSFKKRTALMIGGPRLKYRELNLPNVLYVLDGAEKMFVTRSICERPGSGGTAAATG